VRLAQFGILLYAFTVQQPLNVAGPMHDPEHLDSVFERSIKDQNPLEAGDSEYTQASEVRMPEL
jgi:hypothetical protein